MAGASEEELEMRLSEAGKKLEHPPQSKDELLGILEEVEKCLSMVEQSPSSTMQLAVGPSMNALVKPELLRHQDKDVRLVVITCISEITRITAPEAPYDDNLMREIFQLIVASFEGLNDIESPSFARRVTILETVAKVRSCVVMLDLECDDLILEMFQHFFATASKNHSENVSTSMKLIMTLVLDESEDISQQLLSVLLTSLRRDKQEVSPVAHALAIHVVKQCAEKLRPYLTSEISAEGLTPRDLQKEYHEIVYEICQHGSHALLPIISNNGGHHSVDGIHAPTSVVGNDALTNAQPVNLQPVGKLSADDEDLMRTEEKDVPGHKELERNEDKSVAEGDENGHNDLPQKISDSSVKDEGKENISQDTLSPATNKVSKGRRSVQSRRPTGMSKFETDKSLDNKVLDPVRTTVMAKEGRKSKKSEVLPKVTKVSDESGIASGSQTLSSSKRKRGRSVKDNKKLSPIGQATKEMGSLQSTSQSNMELESTAQPNDNTAGLDASAAEPNEDTAPLATSAEIKEEAAVISSSGPTNKDADSVACLEPLKEIEGLTSQAESSKTADGLDIPLISNKEAEGHVSPTRSTKNIISSPSRSRSAKEAVGLLSSAKSSKEMVGSGSPSGKQSLAEDDDTGTDSSRTKRGRPRNAGRRSGTKDDSTLPSLTIVATERALDSVAGTAVTSSALPNMDEQLEASKDSGTRSSKRSKRKLDESNSNTPKSGEKVLARSKKDLKEMDTPATTQEDGHRPKKMQKVASIAESAEKNLSQDGESSKRTPRSSAKKKSIAGLDKTPTDEKSDEGEKFVGRKIKVWWPQDKQFYDGVIDSYEPTLKKHKILYADGDVEILNLKRQKWEFTDVKPLTEKSSTSAGSPKTAGDKVSKKGTNKGAGSVAKDETESFAKRGSHSSKKRKEFRPQSDVKTDDNGAPVKNASAALSEKNISGTVKVSNVSKENVDQPTSGTKGRQQKQGGESKKGRRVAAASTSTNESAKISKGTKSAKAAADQDKTGMSSDAGARSSDDEPLNAWRSRSRTE